MSGGYVMDLTNREFGDLVRLEIQEDVEASQYNTRGSSKANRLRSLLEICDDSKAAHLLRALWEHREHRKWTPGDIVEGRPVEVRKRYMTVVEELERRAGRSDTSALERFEDGMTLDELVTAINRDVSASRHATALDRLHTYCMKRFANLLTNAGVPCVKEEPLQSRVGKYVKHVTSERQLRPMTVQILKNSMGILQHFNDVRNNSSFAHDNEIVSAEEGRLIFDTVVGLLRFINTIEKRSANDTAPAES